MERTMKSYRCSVEETECSGHSAWQLEGGRTNPPAREGSWDTAAAAGAPRQQLQARKISLGSNNFHQSPAGPRGPCRDLRRSLTALHLQEAWEKAILEASVTL